MTTGSVRTAPVRTTATTATGGIGAAVTAGPPALQRAAGRLPFAADLHAEDMVWASFACSPHAYARILRIDTAPAWALPGVRAVVTAADMPGVDTWGPARSDQPVLAGEVARFRGEPVAVVAADHPETARRAAAAIVVDYDVREAVDDPETALAAAPLHPDGNVIRHIPLRRGDPKAAGDVVVEGLYEIGALGADPFVQDAILALPEADGGVELHAVSGWPRTERDQIAQCLGLPPDRVRLVAAGASGATGTCDEIGVRAAVCLLALRTGRPVKAFPPRPPARATGRPAVRLRCRHHARRDGSLVKVEAQILLDAGAYAAASSQLLAELCALAAGPYTVPNAVVDGWAVRTNSPPRAAGPAGAQPAWASCFAHEAQMDRLASALRMDPVELRLRNVLAPGSILITGQPVPAPAPVAALLQACAAAPLPDVAAPAGLGGHGIRRGVGYAVGFTPLLDAEGVAHPAEARLHLADGVVTVSCSAAETGQGFATLVRQVVYDVLGIDRVVLAPAGTAVPDAGPAGRGRHTWLAIGAVEQAARELREQALVPVARRCGMSPQLLDVRDGRVVSYNDVVNLPIAQALAGFAGEATGVCRPPATEPLDDAGQGDAFAAFAYVVQRAVVDVHQELGQVRVVEVTTAQDVGRGLNLLTLVGHLESGIVRGIGLALGPGPRGEAETGRSGRSGRSGWPGQGAATIREIPQIRFATVLEQPQPGAPYGARGVRDASALATPAAVAAAIRAAIGRELDRVPVSMEDAAWG